MKNCFIRTDAHVHMGYYTRYGYEEPFYYSPRRVVGLMDRCGIDEFIVSTTNSQVPCISLSDILREAREMKRLAGKRAHQFLWVSGRIYDSDRSLKVLDTGLYEGVKLHELETPWYKERRDDLVRILEAVEVRGMKVQFHCSSADGCRPIDLKLLAGHFSGIKFDFAHCCYKENLLEIMEDYPNVYTDTAMFDDYVVIENCNQDVKSRIMFGSDFPAYHIVDGGGFVKEYRKRLEVATKASMDMESAFYDFLK